MKRILVTAGGTATAWHTCQVAKEYFGESVEIQICDTNEPYLVPASTLATKTHKVPAIVSEDYECVVGKIIDDEYIDCIIPLIPEEAFLYAKEGSFVKKHGIDTTAPTKEATDKLVDKLALYKTLHELEIPTPKIYELDELDVSRKYLVKPRLGFGSLGVQILNAAEIKDALNSDCIENCVIQEYCHEQDYDEITVEIFNSQNLLKIFARRRIATKAGVCVKMEPVESTQFYQYVERLVRNIECPRAFNVQFLWDKGQWKLFDCNLRLGAGTALSSAIGFQLTRALLADVTGEKVDKTYFECDKSARSVLRVYQEIVVR